MKVRRKSPICQAVKTNGFAKVKHKGKWHTVSANYVLTLPDGSTAVFQDLSGFRIVQENPLLVQQIHPVEECLEFKTHGIMKNHAGHEQPHKPGDCKIGNPGQEIRRLKEDMQHYEIVEP